MFGLGMVLRRQRDFASAEKVFQVLCSKYPSNAPAAANLAIVLAEQGKQSDARRALERAISLDPANAATGYALKRWPELAVK